MANMEDNVQHMHRHAVHALEDFQQVRRWFRDSRNWTYETEKLMHAVSHHLRHVVYRAEKEINDG